MNWKTLTMPALAAVLALAAAAPAGAQGRRDRDDHHRGVSRLRTAPPGWCRGVGNPHRTAANCGHHTDRIYRDGRGVWRDRHGNVLRRDGVYRDRNGVLRDRRGRVLRPNARRAARSYEQRHAAYHRNTLDRCLARARGRRDVVGRARAAAQCRAAHDAWHRRNRR